MIKVKYTATVYLKTDIPENEMPPEIRKLPNDELSKAIDSEITTNFRNFLKEELSGEFYKIDLSGNAIDIEKVPS